MSLRRSIAVVGSRTYPVTQPWWDKVLDDEGKAEVEKRGREIVQDFMDKLKGDITIVSGGASGPDTWAVELAEERGFKTVVIRPNWKKYGKGAGFKRNKEIVQAADDVVAFWDKVSNGTYDTIKKATKAEKDLLVFGPSGTPMFWITQEDYHGEASILEKMMARKKIDVPGWVKLDEA